ncbi:hypothetical protein D3C87_1925790 [compost metagenome]
MFQKGRQGEVGVFLILDSHLLSKGAHLDVGAEFGAHLVLLHFSSMPSHLGRFTCIATGSLKMHAGYCLTAGHPKANAGRYLHGFNRAN